MCIVDLTDFVSLLRIHYLTCAMYATVSQGSAMLGVQLATLARLQATISSISLNLRQLTTVADTKVPLHLFVTATDAPSDAVAAQIITNLKQQHRAGIELRGLVSV